MGSASVRRIFLARHGQSLANLEKRISGQMDWPLTDKGRDQAFGLADVLAAEPLAAVYASSLGRAVETARPAAERHGLPITELADLREQRFGVLEGRRVDESDPEAQALWNERAALGEYGRIPGGESAAEFRARVMSCLNGLLTDIAGPVLIVGHRNTNALILTMLLRDEPACHGNINVKNKYLYDLVLDTPPRVSTIRLGGERHGQRYPGLVT